MERSSHTEGPSDPWVMPVSHPYRLPPTLAPREGAVFPDSFARDKGRDTILQQIVKLFSQGSVGPKATQLLQSLFLSAYQAKTPAVCESSTKTRYPKVQPLAMERVPRCQRYGNHSLRLLSPHERRPLPGRRWRNHE